MENGWWGVSGGEIGHQMSYKVNIQGNLTKKGDLAKNFDLVCVWDDWIGYIPESMENGCWGVASGGISHQRSFKVTTQGHLKKKRDSTENFDKLCVSYYWKCHLSETVENGSWGVDRGGMGHQRSIKVNIQGHVTKKGDLTKKGLCLV